MSQVLVVSSDSTKFPRGLRLGERTVSRCASAEEASLALAAQPAALLVLDRLTADLRALELLGSLQALRPDLPILVLLPDGSDFPLPSGLHPRLRFAPSWLSSERLLAEIRFSLTNAACRPSRSALRSIDYLAVAVALRQSVDLHVQRSGGGSALFEVVEGNLWNVYSGDLEGEAALAVEIFALPSAVEAVRQQSLPTSRQIRRPGSDVLRDAARYATGGAPKTAAADCRETQPLIIPSSLILQSLKV
jgi:hypothetical protein